MRVATVWVFSLTVRLSVVMAKRGRYSVRENVRDVSPGSSFALLAKP
jgi:hypothetical protein